MAPNPLVNLICGSSSDHEVAQKSKWREIMRAAGIPCLYSDISAHHHDCFLGPHLKEMRGAGVQFFVALVGMKPDLGTAIAAKEKDAIVYHVPIPSTSLGVLDPCSSVLTIPDGLAVRCVGVGARGLSSTALDIWKDLARTDEAMRESYLAFMAAYKDPPNPDVGEEEFFAKKST